MRPRTGGFFVGVVRLKQFPWATVIGKKTKDRPAVSSLKTLTAPLALCTEQRVSEIPIFASGFSFALRRLYNILPGLNHIFIGNYLFRITRSTHSPSARLPNSSARSIPINRPPMIAPQYRAASTEESRTSARPSRST